MVRKGESDTRVVLLKNLISLDNPKHANELESIINADSISALNSFTCAIGTARDDVMLVNRV